MTSWRPCASAGGRVLSPCGTRPRDEIETYEKDFSPGRDRGKHLTPHTTEIAALWALPPPASYGGNVPSAISGCRTAQRQPPDAFSAYSSRTAGSGWVQ